MPPQPMLAKDEVAVDTKVTEGVVVVSRKPEADLRQELEKTKEALAEIGAELEASQKQLATTEQAAEERAEHLNRLQLHEIQPFSEVAPPSEHQLWFPIVDWSMCDSQQWALPPLPEDIDTRQRVTFLGAPRVGKTFVKSLLLDMEFPKNSNRGMHFQQVDRYDQASDGRPRSLSDSWVPEDGFFLIDTVGCHRGALPEKPLCGISEDYMRAFQVTLWCQRSHL